MNELEAMLDRAYATVGAFEPEVIYLYTDFRHFGRYAATFPSRDAFCRAFVAPLLARDKTIVLTTFTYTSEGRFDVMLTPTRLGAMNKWILTQPAHRRSEHPIFSYAALGPQADIVENIGKSAFGHDSVFERLRGRRCAFLHVGRPVSLGNTALHHIEQVCGATYRLNKAFRTEVFRGEQYLGTDYTAFLRRRDVPGETFEFDFTKAAAVLAERGLTRQCGRDDDLSNVTLYPYDQTLDLLARLFYEDQRIFIGSGFMNY